MEHELVLEETAHGLQVRYHGRRLYGPRPRDAASRRIQALTLLPDTLILWPSPLVWHGWPELEGRLSGTSAVLAVEADPVLHELARRRLPDDAGERIALVSADRDDVISALRRLGEHRFRRVVEVTTTASALTARTRYRRLYAFLERELRVFWQNRLILSAMGRLWLRNLIQNIPALRNVRTAPPVPGATVVCGAGPSLESAVAIINRHRNSVTLIAVDTSLPVLQAHGIVPDIVLALEGQLANVYDFLPVPAAFYRLVADLTSAPAAIDRHEGWTPALTRFAPLSLIERARGLVRSGVSLPPLGSVGVAAVHFALNRGASPVFCTGLDFAVLPGKTHARGAPACLHEHVHSNRVHRGRDPGLGAHVITTRGASGTVRSTLVLKGYAQQLEAEIEGRDDVYVVEPVGLAFGARPVTADDVTVLLEQTHRAGHTPATGTSTPAAEDETDVLDGERLRAFVLNERALLESIDLSEGASLQELPAELDYLACEIPDFITSLGDRVRLAPLTASARGRLRVARHYYLDRWNTTLKRLAGGE